MGVRLQNRMEISEWDSRGQMCSGRLTGVDADVALQLAVVGEGHVAVGALELLRPLLAAVERL